MNSIFSNGLLYVVGSIVGLSLIYFLLLSIGILTEVPDAVNLKNWDGSWYSSIVEDGYNLSTEGQSNSGFFPGFPYLWSITGVGVKGIAVINFILFLSGTFFLSILTKTGLLEFAVIVAFPSTFFFYLPYSEALFYLLGVLLIFSWKKGSLLWMILFSILLSFVRPAFFFLIPAVIGIVLLSKDPLKELKTTFLIAFSLITGATLGFLAIGLEVGDYMAYSKSQVNHWGHEFKLPSFPLTTWRGYRILWLDGLALFVTILAMLALVVDFINVRFKQMQSYFTKLEIVGLGYLLMIMIYILFFHPLEDDRTTMISMNRYVFCNPFLHYLLLRRMGKISLTRRSMLMIIISAVIAVSFLGFPFASVVGLDQTKSILFLTGLFGVMIASTLILFKLKYNKLVHILFVVAGVLLQLYLFNSFLKGNWIG
tara:strand:- start:18887 stop:20161 length:1275 start_codon:yes stop_codon:yes gene_type:complete